MILKDYLLLSINKTFSVGGGGALCYFFAIEFHAIDEKLLLLVSMQVLALVGDQLDYGDNICGAVLSVRFNEDIVSVWNRNAADHQVSV